MRMPAISPGSPKRSPIRARRMVATLLMRALSYRAREQSMRPVAPEEERLARAIAEHHVPALARAQFDPLPSGEGNRTYLLNGGPRYRFIIRLVEDLKIHKLKDELAAIEILARNG